MKVYLAGPISGLTYEEATGWRRIAREYFERNNIEVIDPTDKIEDALEEGEVFEWQKPWVGEGSNGTIFNVDIEQGLLQADAIVVGYPTGFRSSGGTAFELGVAYAFGIPVVIWDATHSTIHPFLEFSAVRRSDLVEACVCAHFSGPQTFEEAVGHQLHVLRQLMLDRQRKYGPNNILAGGIHGLITRMGDKHARIKEDHPGIECGKGPCPTTPDYTDEAPLDAYRDVGNYGGVIAPMLLEGTWGLPLLEDTLAT